MSEGAVWEGISEDGGWVWDVDDNQPWVEVDGEPIECGAAGLHSTHRARLGEIGNLCGGEGGERGT